MTKLHKAILLSAMCLAATLANAQTPARKLLLLFAMDAPAATTPTQMQTAFTRNSSVLQRRAALLDVEQVQIWRPQPNQIGIALPDTLDAKKAKALFADNTLITFHSVEDNPAKNSAAKKHGSLPGYLFLPGLKNGVKTRLLINQQVLLDSRAITSAESGTDQNSSPALNIILDNAGGKRFAQITRDNIGRQLALVINRNGKQSVLTAPQINQEISGGRVQISGSMTTTEAVALATALNSGTYAMPVHFVSSSYGPVPTGATSVGPATRNY